MHTHLLQEEEADEEVTVQGTQHAQAAQPEVKEEPAEQKVVREMSAAESKEVR